MARLRPTSRVQTPSDNEAPPKRVTRSQAPESSVELPSPSQITRTRSAKNTAGPAGDQDAFSAGSSKKRGRVGRPKKNAPAPLDAVLEDIEVEPLDDMINSAADFVDNLRPEAQVDQERQLSPSVAPSGITDMTSYSQAELKQLDAAMIIETLAELDRNANRLLEKATPAGYAPSDLEDHVKQLREGSSRLSKQLKQLARQLEATQDGTFGSQRYINPDLILRCLFKHQRDIESNPQGSWRPDAIIYKANLANFVDMICSVPEDVEQGYQALASLDVNFPNHFVSYFTTSDGHPGAGSSTLLQDTFDMALELRTRLAILNLIQNDPQTLEEANDAICQIFVNSYDSDHPSDKQAYRTAAKPWEALPLSQQEIAGPVAARIMALRNAFEVADTSTSEALDLLQRMYSWSKFRIIVLLWARIRLDELNDELEVNGGADMVIKRLEKAMDEWARTGHLEEPESVRKTMAPAPPASVPAASASSKKGYTKEAMAELKKQRKQLQSPAGAGPRPPSAPPITDQQDVVAPDDQEYEDIDAVATVSPMRQTLRHIIANDKENTSKAQPQKKSLFDAQENGQRITFDEEGESQQTRSPMRLQRPRNNDKSASPPKRPGEPEVEDPSEDEGFQQDERAPATKRVRMDRNVVNRPRVASTSTRPANTTPAGTRRASQPALDRASPSLSPRRNPGQSIDPVPVPDVPAGTVPPPMTGSERYRLTQQAGKSVRPNKEQRPRRPWTDEEIEALFDLAGEHGSSYTIIKRADESGANVMQGRSQGDIKDKMRNMKFDYLKARQPLPVGFENVPLPLNMRERLARDYDIFVDQAPQRSRRMALDEDEE